MWVLLSRIFPFFHVKVWLKEKKTLKYSLNNYYLISLQVGIIWEYVFWWQINSPLGGCTEVEKNHGADLNFPFYIWLISSLFNSKFYRPQVKDYILQSHISNSLMCKNIILKFRQKWTREDLEIPSVPHLRPEAP